MKFFELEETIFDKPKQVNLRIFRSLFDELISVQPLAEPTGRLCFFDFMYSFSHTSDDYIFGGIRFDKIENMQLF